MLYGVDWRDRGIQKYHLAIDGKALCGATEKTKGETTPMLLNVVETVRGLILAQLPVDSKTNEIRRFLNY